METTNVNLWAMYSEVQKHVDNYNCGSCTRAELANRCYLARVPYIGKLRSLLLWIRDRWL